MTAPFKRHGRQHPKLRRLFAFASLLFAFDLAQAQQSVVAPPNPEREGLPLNLRLAATPQRAAPATAATLGPAFVDHVLAAPIDQIELQAPDHIEKIQALLLPFVRQSFILGSTLEHVRGQVWELYRNSGRIARIEISIKNRDGGNVLQVIVHEQRIRRVQLLADASTEVSQARLNMLVNDVKDELPEGDVLDIDKLDVRVKRSQFLGDLRLHAMLVPAGEDQLDILLHIGANAPAPPQWVAQVDTYGSRSYGRRRYTAGLMLPGAMAPGDRLNMLATAAPTMRYGRLTYEMPVAGFGIRLSAWTSLVEYQAPAGPEGKVSQFGTDLLYPLHYGRGTIWTAYMNFFHGHQNDHIAVPLPVNDKTINSLQGRVDASFLVGQAHTAYLSLALQQGRLDLSALPSALAQDQLSARSHGTFSKVNWDAAWSNAFGPAHQFDIRIDAKGQAANKNLDESEKFALGGPSAVRAYGGNTAMGDEGFLLRTELGYRPQQSLRVYSFYDYGRIRPHREPWTTSATPARFGLGGTGLGVSYEYRALNSVLAYARPVGTDSIRTANGFDVENVDDRYRFWLSLGARF